MVSMFVSLALFIAQATGEAYPSMSTGLEWMAIASVLIPAVLLIVLVYLNGKKTVRR
jgi:hypothetical protein